MPFRPRTALALACAAAAFPALAQVASDAADPRPARKREAEPRGVLSGKPSPQPVRRADGSDELEHDDTMLNYTVVTLQADGSLAYRCTQGAADARRALKGEPTSFAARPRMVAKRTEADGQARSEGAADAR